MKVYVTEEDYVYYLDTDKKRVSAFTPSIEVDEETFARWEATRLAARKVDAEISEALRNRVLSKNEHLLSLARSLRHGSDLRSHDNNMRLEFRDGRFQVTMYEFYVGLVAPMDRKIYHREFLRWDQVLDDLRNGVWNW